MGSGGESVPVNVLADEDQDCERDADRHAGIRDVEHRPALHEDIREIRIDEIGDLAECGSVDGVADGAGKKQEHGPTEGIRAS